MAVVGTLDMLALHSEPGSLTHGLDLSAWLVLWAALAMIGIVLTTMLLRQPVALSRTTLAFTLAGVALAAAFQLALQQWAAGRLGYSHDLIGLTILVPCWAVGLAISVFALHQAPAPGRSLVRVGGLACVVTALAIIATNVKGAADGVRPDSWVPAMLLMLIAVYSLVAATRLLRQVQSKAPS
ncbi:MAG: hypothetical protein E6I60_06970 [Chloroflexi bacterium]|nr:MAG: hypothetical protein E6I60_06970 [Chloroflexota bacterium]